MDLLFTFYSYGFTIYFSYGFTNFIWIYYLWIYTIYYLLFMDLHMDFSQKYFPSNYRATYKTHLFNGAMKSLKKNSPKKPLHAKKLKT